MKQWESLDAVERNPDKVSGAWVFRGTRVPISALFENLRDGASVDQFLVQLGVDTTAVNKARYSCTAW